MSWRPSRWMVAVAVCVIAGAGAGVAWWLSGQGASAELDRAVAMLESADALVVRIDEVVRSQVTSELAGPAEEAGARVGEANVLLNDALAVLAGARDGLRGREAERGALLESAASARLEMLAQAPAILDTNAKAARALPLAQEGWAAVLEADALSDRAVAAYNKLTDTGVKESQRLNQSSAAKLEAARTRFTDAEAAFPAADFEAYLAYVELRIQLNQLSQRSDADWLAGELQKANAAIASYNTLDSRAVAAAKQLPASPANAVASAYASVADAATDEYYAARARATAADERLRTE